MFQYSFLLKNISCFIDIIVYKTSSEKIEKLLESSLNLISHTCSIVIHDDISHFSVTVDCVRFPIRRFPLYTYSMPKKVQDGETLS